jgi:putrescine transport system permease protein
MLVILPFWTSFLIRVYAWIGILKPEGLLNQLLMSLNIIDSPLIILNTNWAIFIGIVYSYLPFMVLPLYSALEKMDYTLIEAANDLGCPPLRPSGRSPSRCPSRASSRAACWSSSRRSESSSFPICSAVPGH